MGAMGVKRTLRYSPLTLGRPKGTYEMQQKLKDLLSKNQIEFGKSYRIGLLM